MNLDFRNDMEFSDDDPTFAIIMAIVVLYVVIYI